MLNNSVTKHMKAYVILIKDFIKIYSCINLTNNQFSKV
jgi:hypothetical protein